MPKSLRILSSILLMKYGLLLLFNFSSGTLRLRLNGFAISLWLWLVTLAPGFVYGRFLLFGSFLALWLFRFSGINFSLTEIIEVFITSQSICINVIFSDASEPFTVMAGNMRDILGRLLLLWAKAGSNRCSPLKETT